MSGIFLEPESTFSVTITAEGGGVFTLQDGGPITLRTCTGREYAALSKAFRRSHAIAPGRFRAAARQQLDARAPAARARSA